MLARVASPPPSLADRDQTYAALDLGSNSFHLLVAHYHESSAGRAAGASEGGRLQVVDRHRETVRLAEGLDGNNTIAAVASARALACLERLGQRIRHLPDTHVRVVGTNTLRKARNSDASIAAAQRALGHRVEVVSGREEARLIYLGVSHSLEALREGESQLVVDIGGGSTELILGEQFQPRVMESLHMGCVSTSATHFPDGRVTAERFQDAKNAARLELEAVERSYRARGWDAAIGASGTLIAVHDAIGEHTGRAGITRAGVHALKRHLVDVGDASAVGLAAVDGERAPVFPGGLAIVSALLDALDIDKMTVSSGALREGLLHDLLGRVHAEDIRETTVTDLMRRYHVDAKHAGRVAATAAAMFAQVPWAALDGPLARPEAEGIGEALPTHAAERLLRWAAMLHEIGLDISHSQYHKHGGYLLDNMDLPGFSRSEQHDLAALVRTHRRKFPTAELAASPGLTALAVLLRLAVVLHRSRDATPLPAFSLKASRAEVALAFPAKWLAAHPLTNLDLQQEAAYLSMLPLELAVGTR